MNCKKCVEKSTSYSLHIILIVVSFLEFVGIYAISKLYLVLVLHKAVSYDFTFTHIDTAIQNDNIPG